jgi:putative phosphoribosyl transferase
MRFHDRRHAGQELAARLQETTADGDLTDALVLALPRGGVPVAAEVARALHVQMDLLVARKIGAPGAPEVGIGAIVGEEPPVFDRLAAEYLGLEESQMGESVARERLELHRRQDLYRAGRPEPRISGRRVVLVDDGIATGVTARAALRHLRRHGPAHLVLAVPVCSARAAEDLDEEADEVICLHLPPFFHSVGEWYADFHQVSDREVLDTMSSFHATA